MKIYEGNILTCDKDNHVYKYLVEEQGVIHYVGDTLDKKYENSEIIKLGNKFSSFDEKNKKVDKIVEKTENCKAKIAEYYEKAQNAIIKNYFDKSFKHISNLEELDNYRRKLERYGELIGRTDN
jgi:hypothetical protein